MVNLKWERIAFWRKCDLIGDVVMGESCSVWFNAVVRGDVHYIKMGDKVNIRWGLLFIVLINNMPPKLVIMYQ